MGMGMGMGMALGGTPPELGLHPLTLQYTLAPGAPPSFPNLILAPPWAAYADEKWDPSLLAVRYLVEFTGTNWQAIPFAGLAAPYANLLAWQPAAAGFQAFVTGEINDLQVLMQDHRERYLTEIVAQNDGAPEYWVSLLGLDRKTKFWNLVLLHVALRVGELAVMYFKDQFKRPRPSALCPGLCPPFGPPSHPAFPSGHATQGWLMTLCLKAALPAAPLASHGPALDWLAERVAFNRERGGFHYASDSLAGKYLAEQCLPRLQGTASFPGLLNAARAEW